MQVLRLPGVAVSNPFLQYFCENLVIPIHNVEVSREIVTCCKAS